MPIWVNLANLANLGGSPMGQDVANLVILIAGLGGARLHVRLLILQSWNLAGVHDGGEGRILKSCNLAPLGPLAPLEPLAALEPLAPVASFHEEKWCKWPKWLKWRQRYKWYKWSKWSKRPKRCQIARFQDCGPPHRAH